MCMCTRASSDCYFHQSNAHSRVTKRAQKNRFLTTIELHARLIYLSTGSKNVLFTAVYYSRKGRGIQCEKKKYRKLYHGERRRQLEHRDDIYCICLLSYVNALIFYLFKSIFYSCFIRINNIFTKIIVFHCLGNKITLESRLDAIFLYFDLIQFTCFIIMHAGLLHMCGWICAPARAALLCDVTTT